MKVGLYFDLRNPREWQQDWSRLYGFALEMCEEAERLGLDSIWVTEHHLFDDGYLTQPLTFLAAVAARTKRVRLGTAIMLAPLRSAVQIAEEATVVDILSGGRLDLGLGAGYRIPEFQLYGVDIEQRYITLDSRIAELRAIWRAGKVTPPPVQSPLPLWLGYQGPKGAKRAGKMGERLLTCEGAMWPHYRAGLAEGGHDLASGRMAGGVNGWISDDPEADWPVVAKHVAAQMNSYRKHMFEGTDQPMPRPYDPDKARSRKLGEGGPIGALLYGTPEQAAAQIRAYVADAPVETVYFWASIAGMPEAMVARNVQTIARRLKPLLA
jgi:alkanesulfonate monooxygenase SsuD/methylene tetrahydromethanopterin reductase-like flavin-dependent oxidoreductase (luciferase family)